MQQCSEVGMDDFLNKPVEPELLDRVIASYVEVPGYV
jgi:CheY-like chemotaxis protein